MTTDYLNAVVLGIVEGLTEFLPVSSTGHLIIAGKFLGFEGDLAETFDVMIQLGAILAVCVVYFETLFKTALTLPTRAESRRFTLSVLIAFLPACVLGLALHGFIKEVLFSPWVVCASLIVGGIAILVIERVMPVPKFTDSEALTPMTSLQIGLCQCLALIPGVSRSGATILGAAMFGVERKAAAEFSFFLAIPTMLGAFALDAYKNRDMLLASADAAPIIAIGFVISFLLAILVVKTLIGFIGRHGFAPFAWYRIAAGIVFAAIIYMMPGN